MSNRSRLQLIKGKAAGAAGRPPDGEILWLNDYLPYRMAVVASRLLRESAHVYKRRRDPLTTPQWRVLGILANFEPLTASEISRISMLDKVAISRAMAQMVRRGFVRRQRIRLDQRVLEVTLTRDGWRYYRTLAPALKRQERFIRSVLDEGDIKNLFAIFERLEALYADLDERRRRYGDRIEIEDVVRAPRVNGTGRIDVVSGR
jgi:DNA-binding MarR family transcriptional regulator